tara:strand:- start:580 stop:987 length:408 start_codon:yes stop_codon:yes gene_type:complete
MELIYFISGILVVGTVYGVNLLRHVKSSHADLLARFQSQSNISSIRYADMEEEIKTAGRLVADVQNELEKDQYASITKINKELKDLREISSMNAMKLNNSNKAFKTNLTKAFNEIQTLKNNLKALGQDPNFLNRY